MLWLQPCMSRVCIPIQNQRHVCSFVFQPNAGVITHQFSNRGDAASQREQYVCAMYIRAHVPWRQLRQPVNLDKACRRGALVRADARPASTWWICWEGAEPLDTLQWLRDGEGGGGRQGAWASTVSRWEVEKMLKMWDCTEKGEMWGEWKTGRRQAGRAGSQGWQ